MWTLVKQLIRFAAYNKKFWMVPAVLMLLIIGALIVVMQTSTLAPFIYAIF